MSIIDKTPIQAGVMNMLTVNMGVQPVERILVVGDPPTLPNWAAMGSDELERMLERTLLAKAVAEIAGVLAMLIGARDGRAPVDESFWAVRRLFDAMSRRSPLVVVFQPCNALRNRRQSRFVRRLDRPTHFFCKLYRHLHVRVFRFYERQ